MRIIPLLGFLLVLITFGCIGIPGASNASIGGAANSSSGMLNGDNRSFVYDIGLKASPAVQRTIADSTDSPDDAHVIYGTVDLKIEDCLNLTDDYHKTLCLDSAALYLNDSSVCEKVSEGYRSMCYFKLAMNGSDPSFCDRITEPAYQDNCKRELAVQTGNASLCVHSASEQGGAKKGALCKSIASSGGLVGKPECRNDIVEMVLVESGYFGDTMLWLAKNHPGEQVLSWWDYGSSLDCMGMRSVISNQDLKDPLIPQVADLLVSGNETRLADFMRARGVKYVMLDSELLYGSGTLGGKFGALNYLSCVYENKTAAENAPGESRCESDNLWETVFISSKPCRIDAGLEGLTAYKMYYDIFKIGPDGSYNVTGAVYQPYYMQDCMYPTNPDTIAYCKNNVKAVPVYCVANTTISGNVTYTAYPFNNSSNTPMPNRAVFGFTNSIPSTYHFGPATEATLFYTHDRIWLVNGTSTEGYPDRTTLFYDSVLYKGLILDSIDGFNEVYTDPSGSVKVFELSG